MIHSISKSPWVSLERFTPTRCSSCETQTPLKVISVLRFGTEPANLADSIIEADNGDLAVDTRAGRDPQEAQSLRQFKLSAEQHFCDNKNRSESDIF
jgi:hypothetical protein